MRNLRGYGYRVVVAVDEEDAQERAGVVEADLVLVNLVGMTAEEGAGRGQARARARQGRRAHAARRDAREVRQ